MDERILKLQEVVRITALSRGSIYNMAKAGRFPRPVKLSERASGWFFSEIEAWLVEKATGRAGKAGG